ncbi:hypothetical protein [Bacteroides acidifaciens]|uniref:ParA family protein n=1 Tax=Bacteroides acidifaciens TaxID=85831 RepID=UPI00258D8CB4|nr:hypothetical protein [Bacteroides acidifaciens]
MTILVDCPPQLSILTIDAPSCADGVIDYPGQNGLLGILGHDAAPEQHLGTY